MSNISEKFNGPKPIDLNWRIVLKNVLFYEHVHSFFSFRELVEGDIVNVDVSVYYKVNHLLQ